MKYEFFNANTGGKNYKPIGRDTKGCVKNLQKLNGDEIIAIFEDVRRLNNWDPADAIMALIVGTANGYEYRGGQLFKVKNEIIF